MYLSRMENSANEWNITGDVRNILRLKKKIKDKKIREVRTLFEL